ncbi:hypothetical protein RCL1_001960 [Eukaryota sp. TZLM3-RCL]
MLRQPDRRQYQLDDVFEQLRQREASLSSQCAPVNQTPNVEVSRYNFNAAFQEYRHILRLREVRRSVNSDYLLNQPEIDGSHRSILVDWLVEVADEFQLSTETLFTSVDICDRFLSVQNVRKDKLQLAGIACMFLANKINCADHRSVRDYSDICANTYTSNEILRMESVICRNLEFNFSCTSSLSFLRLFCFAMNAPQKVFFLAAYLIELALIDVQFLKYLPSKIASAALCLSQYACGDPSWSLVVFDNDRYNIHLLKDCMMDLYRTFQDAKYKNLAAVREKFMRPRFRVEGGLMGIDEYVPEMNFACPFKV